MSGSGSNWNPRAECAPLTGSPPAPVRAADTQVDRFFSNTGVDVWNLFASWVPFVVGPRPEIVVALDWTEFDADNQSTIALYLVTKHGRATPLLWKTVVKSELKGWRNEHEDVLLERLRQVLPEGVKVTVLADRGFGDQALYELLKDQLYLDFIVRFRGIVKVADEHGVTKTANEWVPGNGRPCLLRKARVTKARREVGAVPEPLMVECGAIRVAIRPGFDRETLAAVLDVLSARGGSR